MVAQYGAGRKTRIKDFSSKPTCSGSKKKGKFNTEASAIYPFFKKGLERPLMPTRLGQRSGSCCIDWEAPTTTSSSSWMGRVKQLYPVMSDNRVETAHLSTYTRKDKRRKQNVDKVSTEVADIDKHLSSTMANLVHGGDSCALVFAGQHLGDIPFTTNHDSVSGRPGREMDTIVVLKKGLKEVFVKNPLKKFVELNGLNYREHKAPRYEGSERYDINLLDDATYPYS